MGKKKSSGFLTGFFTILLLGGVVGAIGVASDGFNQDVMKDWFVQKEDYTKINLSNKYDKKELTTETALEFLNYDYKVNERVDLISNVYLSSGGMMFDGSENTAVLKTKFKDVSYNRIAITGHQYYEESYQNESGDLITDSEGKEVLQSYICAVSKLEVNSLDPISYVTNEKNNKKAPKTETKKFEFDVKQDSLYLKVTEGRFVITSIELYNVTSEEIETSSSSTASSNQTSSVA